MGKRRVFEINLRRKDNPNCDRRCNKEMRKELTEHDVCRQTNSVLDDLPIRCVGDWAYDKIYRLTQYFGIFSNGMKDKWSQNLNYIEICSGPGRCITRNNGEEIDGTALAILNHKAITFIQKALFIDINELVVNTLNLRIKAIRKENIASAVKGDYTNIEYLKKIINSKINKNSLNLVFIDPTDCSVPFKIINELKTELKNMDLILNIAMGTDILRNIKSALLDRNYSKVREKYISFLGSDSFFTNRKIIKWAELEQNDKLRKALIDEYQKNLKVLGFKYMDLRKVRHYYYLLFTSAHERGLDFWKKANSIEPDSQKTFDFDFS